MLNNRRTMHRQRGAQRLLIAAVAAIVVAGACGTSSGSKSAISGGPTTPTGQEQPGSPAAGTGDSGSTPSAAPDVSSSASSGTATTEAAPATPAAPQPPAGGKTSKAEPGLASAAKSASSPANSPGGTKPGSTGGQGSGGGGAPTPGTAPAPAPPVPSSPGSVPGITDSEIKIGCAVLLGGPLGEYGRGWKAGQEAYVKMVNEAGGINGRKIKLLFEDTGFDPARAVAGTKKLVEVDKVFMLCDTDYAAEFLIVPYADSVQVPQMVLGIAGEGVRSSKFSYGGTASSKNQSKAALRWAASDRQAKTIGVIYLDNEWGKSGLAGAEEAAKELNLRIVVSRSVKPGQADMDSVVLAMRSANPDFILNASEPVTCVKGWLAAQRQQYKPPKGWLGTACYFDSVAQWMGDWGDGFQGLASVDGPYAEKSNPEVATAVRTIKKYFPKWDPNTYGTNDWHVTKILVEALKRAGRDLTREKILSVFQNDMGGFRTGMEAPDDGLTYSVAQHEGPQAQKIVEIKKGAWVPVSDWVHP